MVDFQSRDRKRGLGDSENDEEDAEETAADETTADDGDAETHSGENSTSDGADEVRHSRTVTETYGQDAVTYAVATVDADRSMEEDRAGEVVVDAVAEAGDAVVTRELLAPSYDGVQSALDRFADREDVAAVVFVGGAGVAPSDVTVDAVKDLLDEHLPGFGELFRVLSHDQEGTAVVRTRATAGIVDDVPVFCLPGDPDAARRGIECIVLQEAPALVAEASDGSA
jgi:molybdenum cofactor biosynthesis protein B